MEDERLRRGVRRAGGDEDFEVGERGGGVGLRFDQLQQAVDRRRLGIQLRRRHRDVRALAAVRAAARSCRRRFFGGGG